MSIDKHTEKIADMTMNHNISMLELSKRGFLQEIELELYALDSSYTIQECAKILNLIRSKLDVIKL